MNEENNVHPASHGSDLLYRELDRQRDRFVRENNREPERLYIGHNEFNDLGSFGASFMMNLGDSSFLPGQRAELHGLRVFVVAANNHIHLC